MLRLAKSYWVAPVAFVLSFLVYIKTLCPTVYVEGTGELIGAAHFLGTAHPTGYPLFCLFGRLFSAFLPFGEVAYKINLATACSGALATAALSAFLRWRSCHPWTALAVGLAFGFSSTFWSQVVVAEVYGLSTFAIMVVMGVGIKAAESRDERSFILLFYLMGLGLTTHLSQVLVWPGLALLLAWRWPELRHCPGMLGKALLALGGGYSIVFYLPLRSGRGPGFHWGPLDNLDQLWAHLSGAVYRSSFLAMPWEGAALNAERWGAQMLEEFSLLLAVLPIWGIWVAWQRDRSSLLAAGTAVLMNLVAAWNYHRDPNGLGVFFLLSILGMALFLGFALDDVGRRLARVLGEAGRVVAGTLVVLVVLVGNYEKSDRSQNWIPYQYGREILQGLPENAVLVAEGDDASFLLDYLKRVEGMRPDVDLYNRIGRGTDLLRDREYLLAPARQNALRARREGHLILAGGRPIYYLVPRRSPLDDYTFFPVGLCYQVRPKQAHADSANGYIDFENARNADLYRDPWVRKIQSNYWFMLGERQRRQGQKVWALQAYEKAAEIAYDSRTVHFNVALMYFKNNQLNEAVRHLKEALKIDPWQLDPYRLMAKVLRQQGNYREAEKLLKRARDLQGRS
jgi:tetratricopeptide (TPR) repeat protein